MKAYKRIAVTLVVASVLTLSGCWVVRGNDGGGGRYRDDHSEQHDNRRDNGDQRDQGNANDRQPPKVQGTESSGLR
jgi:hypothetical protein